MKLRHRLWVLMSQAVNALAFRGDPDESLSARCWRQREIPAWQTRVQRIDRLLGEGHCQRARDLQLQREAARK